MHGTSPPHSSGTILYSVSCCFTASGFAPILSILFIATIMETPAAFAWFIASTVCGMIPSSAATTSIAISVAIAPLALIAVNASCPGVSRKVISFPFTWTRYAPICCVIPPASPTVTFAWRIASSREVFPWSTCPITTTTGALSIRLLSSSSLSSIILSSIVTTTSFSTFAWNSIATRDAVSKSMVSFIFAATPIRKSFLITSAVVAFNLSASSFTVISSGIDIVIFFFFLSASILLRRSCSVSLLPLFCFPFCWERWFIFCLWAVWFSLFIFSLASLSYFSLYLSTSTTIWRVSTTFLSLLFLNTVSPLSEFADWLFAEASVFSFLEAASAETPSLGLRDFPCLESAEFLEGFLSETVLFAAFPSVFFAWADFSSRTSFSLLFCSSAALLLSAYAVA